jgi:hypothetical protein
VTSEVSRGCDIEVSSISVYEGYAGASVEVDEELAGIPCVAEKLVEDVEEDD